MSDVRMLDLPETSIAYDVVGDGPWLFFVGAPVGMNGFAALAAHLSDRYSVVTHDPRGIGASHLHDDTVEPEPARRAGDLIAVADSVGASSAQFFGASGGAVTLLELIRQRPDLATRTVIHEAPLVEPLGDTALAESFRECFALAKSDPLQAAQRFFVLNQIMNSTGPGDPVPVPAEPPALPPELVQRMPYELGRMAGPTVFYEPDYEGLSEADLVLTAGARSYGQFPRRATEALAAKLRKPVLDVPGNHLAPSTEASQFAEALVRLLND